MFTCQVELLNSSARTVLRVWNGVCLKEATRRTASHRHWPTDGQVETDTRPRGSHRFLRRNSEACTKIGAGLASFALPWIPAQPAQQMVAPSPTGHTCPRTPPFRTKYPSANKPSRTRKRQQPILGRRWFLRRAWYKCTYSSGHSCTEPFACYVISARPFPRLHSLGMNLSLKAFSYHQGCQE